MLTTHNLQSVNHSLIHLFIQQHLARAIRSLVLNKMALLLLSVNENDSGENYLENKSFDI